MPSSVTVLWVRRFGLSLFTFSYYDFYMCKGNHSQTQCATRAFADLSRSRRTAWLAVLLVGLLSLGALDAHADKTAEQVLVMVEQSFCEWCEAWEQEVGVVYNKTAEGKRAPLVKIDIKDPVLASPSRNV